VATCFIFTQHFDEEHCLCLRLDEQGQVDAPLAARSIHDTRVLQLDARTIVVAPSQSSSLHEVELPWLAERKARAAIPYALEEQLAQNVTTLHFSFDREHYKNNRYLVAVTDKQFLADLMIKLEKLTIHFDIITLDWFALKDHEVCVTEDGLLIRDSAFNGALNGELAAIYLATDEKKLQYLTFQDSTSVLNIKNSAHVDSLFLVWAAQRLVQSDPMNLCQAELTHDTRKTGVRHWYYGAAIIASVLLISVLFIDMLYLHSLTTRMTDVDKKIAVIYREFFPQAKQIVSPRFRITQFLTAGLSSNETASLWSLLDVLGHAFKGSSVTIEQFRFQNRVLSVTLVSDDFASLEGFQQRLQQGKVKVRQAQASTQEQKVVATLELSL
jgi:general secretion pathway protein L